MNFIPLCKEGGAFLFFVSLLLIVCMGGLQLIVTVFLRMTIITRYRGFRVRVLFQLAVSPFKLIDKVMEDMGYRVGRMLNDETSHNRTVVGHVDHTEEKATIDGLRKKYSWWNSKQNSVKGREIIVADIKGMLDARITTI
jgi:hypothetical protein